MPTDWPIATDPGAYLRQLDKRLVAQERRAAATSAADLVGPGIAARAIQVYDWNDETTTFNGFFYSTPGALHAPESGFEWNGSVTARADGSGTQTLSNPQGTATFLQYSRTFRQHPDDPAVIVFGPWKQFLTATGTIGTPQLDETVVTDISTALEDAAAAIQFTESAIWVFRQATAPVPGVGDAPATFKQGYVWYDTDDSDRMRVWVEDTDSWEDPDYPLNEDAAEALAEAVANAAAALAAAEDAIDLAENAAQIYYQPTMPAGGAAGYQWFDTDDGNRFYVHNGTTYADPALTLVNATLRTPYNAGTGSSPTVVPGVVIGSGGIGLYGNLGTTVFMNAATGAFTAKGDITSGSTVTGAVVTGGTIQTESTAARGMKMSSTGMIGYDGSGVATFSYTAATGAIALKGSLTSGSEIAGALITGVLQTDADALEGTKISNSGVFIYDTVAHIVKFSADHIGNVFLQGALSASTIASSSFTGGTVQTDAASNTGIKLTTTGLVAYGGGSPKVVLDATTGNITLAGSVIAGGEMVGTIFRTNGTSTANRVIVSDESGAGWVRFFYGYSGENQSTTGGIAAITAGTPRIQIGSGVHADSGRNTTATFTLTPGNGSSTAQIAASTFTVTGVLDASGGISSTANAQFTSAQFSSTLTTNAGLVMNSSVTSNFIFDHTSANFNLTGLDTTAGSFYITATAGGRLRRSGAVPSAVRFKENFREFPYSAQTMLKMKPILYDYKDTVEEVNWWEGGPFDYVGFGADWADDLGLDLFVIRHDGITPHTFDYAKWGAVAGQVIDQWQQEQIEAIEAKYEEKFQALEERLAAAGI